MPWNQAYDPAGHWLVSTLLAALPVFVLLGTLAFLKLKAHWAASLGLLSALLVALAVFAMPAGKGAAVAVYGAAYGLFPIGWIILNVIFLYSLAEEKGYFTILRESLAGVTRDRRLQLLLIAFSFGAFFEGAAGFGTPVAVSAAILIGLGFSPLLASGLSLIANTAPVAFGALGTPLIALAGVTGLDLRALSAMVGRQLPAFSIIIPFWLVWVYAGWRGMAGVWPALLVAGVSFAVPQFLLATFHGPWLAGVGAAVVSIGALLAFLRVWTPRTIWLGGRGETWDAAAASTPPAGGGAAGLRARAQVIRAWVPWLVLSGLVFLWGIPAIKNLLDGVSLLKIRVPGVDRLIYRVPPVVPGPAPEAAVFSLNGLSATGSGIFLAALVSAAVMGYSLREMARVWWKTLKRVRFSLFTVSAMMAIGFVSRYAGLDATMGLAFARTGVLYPFFGTMLGWLGVALTGSDTSSNVLFGSLQKITAGQLGLSPTLMAAANSSGGVMGKMIDAQSIVVASTATKWYGQEGRILRFVFFHSLALAGLMGLLVMLEAYL
ncbi:MAG: L-lactate permease [Candidatus Aminicenantales bacterium]|jgi:lactate permease